MSFLKNVWYVAGWSHELGADAKVARMIADVPVLMFRDARGDAVAMLDRCAHRLAPLSAGKVCNGQVKCAYHGLVFNGEGMCVENPHGAIVNALRVPVYVAEERYGIIWLWLGEKELADPAKIPDLSSIPQEPATAYYPDYLRINANHQLLVDNILDLSHIDFLHPTLLGSGSMMKARPNVEQTQDRVYVKWLCRNDKAIPLFAAQLPDPEMMTDAFFEVSWYPGGAMQLSTGAAPVGLPREAGPIAMTAHIMTPETKDSTHYFWCMWRNYKQDDAEYNKIVSSNLRNAFALEDRPMIEAQQLRVHDAETMAKEATLLAIDAAPTAARRIYAKMLAQESTASASAAPVMMAS